MLMIYVHTNTVNLLIQRHVLIGYSFAYRFFAVFIEETRFSVCIDSNIINTKLTIGPIICISSGKHLEELVRDVILFLRSGKVYIFQG